MGELPESLLVSISSSLNEKETSGQYQQSMFLSPEYSGFERASPRLAHKSSF